MENGTDIGKPLKGLKTLPLTFNYTLWKVEKNYYERGGHHQELGGVLSSWKLEKRESDNGTGPGEAAGDFVAVL